jgi:hypothetical protein
MRVCDRCGRGRAELGSDDGAVLTMSLDAHRMRELSAPTGSSEMRTLTELVLEKLAEVREIVLDAEDGVLRGLLSFGRGSDMDVVTCTAQEGLGLAVRGGLKIYATDEALALATQAPQEPKADTVH